MASEGAGPQIVSEIVAIRVLAKVSRNVRKEY